MTANQGPGPAAYATRTMVPAMTRPARGPRGAVASPAARADPADPVRETIPANAPARAASPGRAAARKRAVGPANRCRRSVLLNMRCVSMPTGMASWIGPNC